MVHLSTKPRTFISLSACFRRNSGARRFIATVWSAAIVIDRDDKSPRRPDAGCD
jgi:hypothetical protein